jgi:hypothetical protein
MFPSEGQQSPMDINHLEIVMANVVYNVCKIFVMPVEMALHPFYGSTYCPPVILFFSAVMMIMLPLFSAVAGAVAHMIPLIHVHPPLGMFGIGALSQLFFLGGFIHGIRIWRKMIHPERELISDWEGQPLPIFTMLPKSSWWTIRIAYEPLFLLVASNLLQDFYILQPSAAHYLMFAAVALAFKEYTAWYLSWRFLRGALNAHDSGPILARIMDNTATDNDRAALHLASIPKDTPDELRRETVAYISRAFNVNKKGDMS